MSTISNRHTVLELTKTSKALTGQRLARIIAKKNKDGVYESENLTSSKCISVPKVTTLSDEQLKAMLPHCLSLIQDAQDSIIRESIIKTGAREIPQESIDVSECIKYLDSDSSGGRITTEYLQQWFIETYSEAAYEFIASVVCKFGDDFNSYTPDQLNVIETKTNVLRDMFAGWASGKYAPDMPKCRGMIRFAEFVGEDQLDSRMEVYKAKAQKRLDQLIAETSVDALGL